MFGEWGDYTNLLINITTKYKRWGFKLCYYYIRNVKGYKFNHKRIYRIYKQLELNLRIKPKNRIKRDKPDALAIPTSTNEVWSMDFMTDSLTNGTNMRSFNIVDDYNKEALALDISNSLPTTKVIKSLTQVIEQKGRPKILRCDNGPEYISHKLKYWAKQQGTETLGGLTKDFYSGLTTTKITIAISNNTGISLKYL